MNGKWKKNFLLILLTTRQYLEVNLQEKRKTCSEILASENQENLTNSIFYHVVKTGCLVCATPECDYYSDNCKGRWAKLGKIPMYNNILEFGLSGKYLPEDAVVKIHMSKSCHIRINIFSNRERRLVTIQLKECPKPNGGCNIERHVIISEPEFDNQYCFYIGVAIYETDKVHISSSSQCNKFASANFSESNYYTIQDETCQLKKDRTEPEVEFRFQEERERTIDGVPVIFPCSSGGFVVDPKTGRFVTGEICWEIFGKSEANDDEGINFLIKNIYQENENLRFPKRDYRSSKEYRPIFIGVDGKAKSRESMSPFNETNVRKGGRKRSTCDYVGPEPEALTSEEISKHVMSTSAKKLSTKAVISGLPSVVTSKRVMSTSSKKLSTIAAISGMYKFPIT
ncbi:UNVERIFIED_CONTAM: hypothetical protein RMT77_013687 [Armadillidium vulgare]